MKKTIFICLFITSLCFNIARAGGLLGLSYSMCANRLGEPTNHATSDIPPASEVYTFKQGIWGISIHLWDRQAHCITYLKKDLSPITNEETQTILAAYGDGRTWSPYAKTYLKSEDGTAVAGTSENSVTIFSNDFFFAALTHEKPQ